MITTRSNQYLAKGDTVLLSGYLPVTVTDITLAEQIRARAGQPVIVVSWSKIDYCMIQLDNGQTVYGSQIEPVQGRQKQYQYPEQNRLN